MKVLVVSARAPAARAIESEQAWHLCEFLSARGAYARAFGGCPDISGADRTSAGSIGIR